MKYLQRADDDIDGGDGDDDEEVTEDVDDVLWILK